MSFSAVTFLVGLCLGIVGARQSFAQSEAVLTVLRERMIDFDLDTNGTFVGADDEDSGWTMDSNQSPVDLHRATINEVIRHMLQGLTMDDNNCWCKGYTCGCCYQLNIPKIHLKNNVCLTITYLVYEVGIQVSLTVGGKVIINQKISVRNPPPICATIPFAKKLASLCLRFSNLDFSNKHFSGCVALEAKFLKIVVEKIDLGCFKIPPHTVY